MWPEIFYTFVYIFILFGFAPKVSSDKHRQFYDISGRFQMPWMRLIRVGNFFKLLQKQDPDHSFKVLQCKKENAQEDTSDCIWLCMWLSKPLTEPPSCVSTPEVNLLLPCFLSPPQRLTAFKVIFKRRLKGKHCNDRSSLTKSLRKYLHTTEG